MTITHPQPNTDQNVFQPTGDLYEVRLCVGVDGQELTATVAGDCNTDGPLVWIIVPPLNEAEDTGVGYELNEEDAAQLGNAIYSSLSAAGRLRFVAALGQEI